MDRGRMIHMAQLLTLFASVQALAVHGPAIRQYTPLCRGRVADQPMCSAEERPSLGAAVYGEGEPSGGGDGLRDLRGLWGQLVGQGPAAGPAHEQQLEQELESPVGEDAFVPLVLVVGATGRTGRIVVRKLVLKGFRVAVLVRSLSTETLNLLGSGESFGASIIAAQASAARRPRAGVRSSDERNRAAQMSVTTIHWATGPLAC